MSTVKEPKTSEQVPAKSSSKKINKALHNIERKLKRIRKNSQAIKSELESISFELYNKGLQEEVMFEYVCLSNAIENFDNEILHIDSVVNPD